MDGAVDPGYHFYYNTGLPTRLLRYVMKEGNVGLVLGHKQTGKTTTALQAIQEGLSQGLDIHYVSLRHLKVTSQITPQAVCGLLAIVKEMIQFYMKPMFTQVLSDVLMGSCGACSRPRIFGSHCTSGFIQETSLDFHFHSIIAAIRHSRPSSTLSSHQCTSSWTMHMLSALCLSRPLHLSWPQCKC